MCIERLFFGDFSSGATEVRECGGSLTSRSEVMGTPKLLGCRGQNYKSAGAVAASEEESKSTNYFQVTT
jgi:hypothetical protein